VRPARAAILLLCLVAAAEAGFVAGRIGGLADGRAVVEDCARWCTHTGASGAVVLAGECLCEGVP
jgi:hypothetical protein